MRGAEEQAVLSRLQLIAQRAPGNRRMRLRDVADGLQLAHRRFGGLIIDRGIAQLAETPDFTAEQLFNARPVVRLADVHGVGQRRLGGFWHPLAALQIARNGVVGVGGGDKALDRQPQRLGQQTGGQIAEVAARHGNHQLIAGFLRQLRRRFEVVTDLRQQAADVDGVSRVETQRRLQLFIVKRLLHQRLAGIKVAINRHGFNIAAEGTEQLLLQRTDLAARIEDHYLDVRQAVESMRHRRPGVARGRGEDGDRLIACDVGQHLRHKAAAEILERQRRAMEQLQTADIFLNLAYRRRKRKRRAHPLLQDILRDLIADKGG